MVTRYDVAYYAAAPALLPYLAWRWGRKRKYRESGPAMMGRALPQGAEAAKFAGGSIWLHAVSVGEVAAARAVKDGLREVFPGLPLVMSTTTETGQEAARRTIPDADAHIYFPADVSPIVAKFLDVYRPRVVVLMETEIWPNFLTMSAARGSQNFLLNGKLSDRSFPRYRKARGLLADVFGSLRGVCVQTKRDAERFAELGIAKERIRVTGNCKFDAEFPTLDESTRAARRAELGIAPEQPVVVVGSTHEGEEDLMLYVYDQLQRNLTDPAVIIAPRHPERFEAVAETIRRRKLRFRRASRPEALEGGEKGAGGSGGEPDEPPKTQIVLLDKMGVLAESYGLGEVAVVAGSFCPTGGHNLLEAAAHGIPVVYGPQMHSQRELARLFELAGAGTQVDEQELPRRLVSFLMRPEEREKEGRKARAVLERNQGSARRCIEAIGEWRSSGSGAAVKQGS